MSKVDALRAMREARYAEQQKRAAAAPRRAPVAVAPPAPASKRSTAAAAAPEAASAGAADELCGHRNMGGRTCTRERGHTQKSHRYS